MTDEKIEVLARAIIYVINLVTNKQTKPEDILSALSKVRGYYIAQYYTAQKAVDMFVMDPNNK